jgi:hypothetical protein
MRPRITSAESCARVCSRFLQIGGRRRQDEHADDVGAGLFAQLLRALPVDIEQNVPSRRKRRFDRHARRAVALVEHGAHSSRSPLAAIASNACWSTKK